MRILRSCHSAHCSIRQGSLLAPVFQQPRGLSSPPQEVPPPPVRGPVEQQMPMRLQCQWGYDGYMQPMPQDTYMWTWPAMQPVQCPVQCQEWIWPVPQGPQGPQGPQAPAPGPAVCTEAFVAAGHIVPELQGLTREQVAAVLKEAAQACDMRIEESPMRRSRSLSVSIRVTLLQQSLVAMQPALDLK